MEIKLIQTAESDGLWYKVYVGDNIKACASVTNWGPEVALEKAQRVYDFYVENKGQDKVIKITTVEL